MHVVACPKHDTFLLLFTMSVLSPLQSDGIVAHVAGVSQQIAALGVAAFLKHNTFLLLLTMSVLSPLQFAALHVATFPKHDTCSLFAHAPHPKGRSTLARRTTFRGTPYDAARHHPYLALSQHSPTHRPRKERHQIKSGSRLEAKASARFHPIRSHPPPTPCCQQPGSNLSPRARVRARVTRS